VIRVVSGAPVILRRARGYAPLPLPLPLATPQSLVALGAHLKNTFTLAQSATAYVSPHVGDLDNVETLDHLRATLAAYRRLFHVEPRVAVRDLHPGYLSSRAAEELGLPTVMTVQHHHAHVAAVAAEHGVRDSVIGIAYDGVGYGEDGTVWGSEILTATLTASEGFGRLRSAPLPGGDLAARRPWRAALGYLSLDPGCAPAFTLAFEGIRPEERAGAEWQIAHRLNAPLASSMGRLFDAAAAVLGTRRVASYEGQAAMELEDLAGTRRAEPLPFPVVAGGGDSWIMDPLPLLVALGERRRAGDGVPELSARFHESIAGATIAMARRAREARGIGTVALGGGVFQNRRLLSRLSRGLRAHRFKVLLPRRLGPNDGAISYGQAAIAAARLSCGAERGDA
jgi:hydrogenase maturation protein HypF